MTDARLKVYEIFYSLQGESSLTGKRFSFIRLSGCPLRCHYCDTQYAYAGGQWLSIEEIIATIQPHQTRWVCLTGGEPLAHPQAPLLVRTLVAQGYRVTIETGGEEDVSAVAGIAKIIMDIKTPESGVKSKRCFENLALLQPSDEIKFVICSQSDFEWALGICREYRLCERFEVLFSPVFETPGLARDLAVWLLEHKLEARLQTQLHKHLWGAEARGV